MRSSCVEAGGSPRFCGVVHTNCSIEVGLDCSGASDGELIKDAAGSQGDAGTDRSRQWVGRGAL